MYLIMTINETPFTEVELDFSGKDSVRARTEYLEEIAAVLEDEFSAEIYARGGNPQYHYTTESRANNYYLTDAEFRAFDIKVKALKFIRDAKTKKK